MSTKLEEIQSLFQKRNARKRGPLSSDQYNDNVEEIAHDLAEQNDQWNNRLIPMISAIPDSTDDTTIDAYANGLDGANFYVKQDASAVLYSIYFNIAQDRPNTVMSNLIMYMH